MDTARILAKVSDPGFIMVAAGAVIAYGAPLWIRILPEGFAGRGRLILQAAGCVIAAAGAVILFT